MCHTVVVATVMVQVGGVRSRVAQARRQTGQSSAATYLEVLTVSFMLPVYGCNSHVDIGDGFML